MRACHQSGASEINRKGEIIGWACYNKVAEHFCEGFVRSPSEDYSMLPYNPEDINDGGYVTGEEVCENVAGCPSYVWAPDGTLTEFDPYNSESSSGVCINGKGLIAGSYWVSGPWHGYIRAADGTIRSFDPPGSTGTSVAGCDAKGDVTGYYLDSSGASHGFLRNK